MPFEPQHSHSVGRREEREIMGMPLEAPLSAPAAIDPGSSEAFERELDKELERLHAIDRLCDALRQKGVHELGMVWLLQDVRDRLKGQPFQTTALHQWLTRGWSGGIIDHQTIALIQQIFL